MEILTMNKGCDASFIEAVKQESGQDPAQCYQCGNCTAGCPYTFAYDIPVNQIMRLLQAGQKERILKSKSLWLCATCESCTTRCPQGIDVALIMDVLRHMARREGHASVKNVKTFYDGFLESVKRHGRVFEVGVAANYNLKTGRFWTGADLAPKALSMGKLEFRPHEIKGREEITRIFRRHLQREEAGK
ncbi:4Fe-4S dicluster domain-containing protein [Salidesulfovibrio brasiliensis]|uniref:4Fe-4S dicluster domain-containing protein n=1 Tax=Salidesulfovibrio brasiliensis TaxID=221711 RepID=UPI0006D02124|nr:4Fe-4S dicluster domain-containing protein [Salidesulfovibrio brasiliensis]